MAYMIKIDNSKVDKMSELTEKILKHGGKLMSCLEELMEEGEGGSMENRYDSRTYGVHYREGGGGGSMGNRQRESRYGAMSRREEGGGSMGNRDDDEEDDDELMERRRRDSKGRYR